MHLKAVVGAGPLLMFSSAFIFAIMDCLIKFVGPSFRVWDIAFYRFGCGMAILLLVFGRHGHPFRCRNRRFLILRGLAGSVSFCALVLALRMIPISTAMVLFYSYPAFAALFSAVLYRERASRELIWIVVSLAGVAVFFDFRPEGSVLGQVISVVGAAFSGFALATLRKARETNNAVMIYLYFCLTGAIVTFVPFVSNPQLPVSAIDWVVVSGIVLTSLVAQLLMNEGFHYCRSFEGSLMLTSELIFVAAWGLVFLGETATWRFWVGAGMIFASMIGLTCSTASAQSRCSTP